MVLYAFPPIDIPECNVALQFYWREFKEEEEGGAVVRRKLSHLMTFLSAARARI